MGNDGYIPLVSKVAFMIILVTLVVVIYNYLHSKIDKYFLRKEKTKRLNDFYNKMKNGRNSLLSHLSNLEALIMEVSSTKIPTSERHKIIEAYSFYLETLDKIFFGLKVSEDDLIRLAELHVRYCEFIEDCKIMKNKDFHSKYKLFYVNLN